ncbi:hypothetical protein VTI74DRAFT_27 [Chaetomium olivicolor]
MACVFVGVALSSFVQGGVRRFTCRLFPAVSLMTESETSLLADDDLHRTCCPGRVNPKKNLKELRIAANPCSVLLCGRRFEREIFTASYFSHFIVLSWCSENQTEFLHEWLN